MSTSKLIAVFLIASSCLWCCVSAKDTYLNETALTECTNPTAACYFFDPLLWVNESFPENNDSAYMSSSSTIYIYLNASTNFTNLIIGGNVFLSLNTNAAVDVLANVTLEGNATVYLIAQTQIISRVYTQMVDTATLTLAGGAYAQDGSLFVLSIGATINVLRSGYFGLYPFTPPHAHATHTNTHTTL
jgi:hypothetical protein